VLGRGDAPRHDHRSAIRVISELVSPGIAIPLVIATPAAAAHGQSMASSTPAPVSRFTTYFEPGQPRVINIRRAVKLLDRKVIFPGRVFSMNAALGPRTRARGFVPAPMISGGVLVDSVGGGISQVATTLYNAAFFAGLRLIAHTPHSFYISRYPMGREATISWGGPELMFENNWRSPILMRFRATATSIAVTFYSDRLGRHVSTRTGRPYAFVRPVTRYIRDPTLAPGRRVVIQPAGGPGFSVNYSRRVYQNEELRSNERFHVRYDAIDEVIAVSGR
jgi:vancomycin resistance protein YoaR